MMQSTSTTPVTDIAAIQRKAYELWLSGGCREGVAEQNWAEAERLVSESQAAPALRTAPVSEPPSAPRLATSAVVTEKPNQKKSLKRH